MLTGQYNNYRTGANIFETTLSPSNVSPGTFGLLFTQPVDGNIFAQPLYVPDLTINGAVHNVVIVATLNNSVYAFDADTSQPALWHASLGTPVRLGTPTEPAVGIMSTPVIDTSSQTIFVVTFTRESGATVYRLHALNLLTGVEITNIMVQGAVAGTGDDSQSTPCTSWNGGTVPPPCIPFRANEELQRPALLEDADSATIYVAFGSLSGQELTVPYHGWLIGYEYASGAFTQTMIFTTTQSATQTGPACSDPANQCGHGAGIWMSGRGPALDATGIYVVTGNGGYGGAGSGNWGESFLRLNGAGVVEDSFTPANFNQLNNLDLDLCAGGMILFSSSNATVPNLALVAGKTGAVTVMNRASLGGLTTGNAGTMQNFMATTSGCGTGPGLAGCYEIHNPALWNRTSGDSMLYVWAQGDVLRVWDFAATTKHFQPDANQGTLTAQGYPGGGLAVSANGDSGGIVWAIVPTTSQSSQVQGILYAFDATNVGTPLWASTDYWFPTKFTIPTIVNGKVYVPTSTLATANPSYTPALRIYGMCACSTNSALASSSAVVGSAAGNGTVLLISNGPWTATSNASWLQVAAGSASGAGSALIQFSYSANSNPGAQTGTLTIAGLTFTVTQAGTSYVPVTPVAPLVSSGLNNPQGAAVDGQGNVYIADTANSVIKEWSPGTQQTVVLSSAVNNPSAVAVDGHGNVYIADSGNHAIEEFSAANQQLTTLVSGLSNPSGVAVDGQGNVCFSDTSNNVIDKWNAASQRVTTLAGPSGLSNPTGVAVDGQGNVYFADSGHNAIKKWVTGGQVTALVSSGLNNPTGVAVNGQDNVYIADTGDNAIKQWNAGNQQVATLVSTGLNGPMGVAVDGQGTIYIADTNNSAIKKLTPAYLALSASSLSEGAQAGTDSVTAQVLPAGVLLTATSDQSWLTITGIASGVIGFSFPSNTTGANRTAHIVVLGLPVTVTQSGDAPASVTKCAGDGQSTPLGQPFATVLQVCVTDAGGNPLSGWPVTFSVTPGATGAGGTFGTSPPMPILTNASGSASAPTLTANGIEGTFTVTAGVNGLNATFSLTNIGYALAGSSALVGSAAGNGTALLITNGPWTAASNVAWLQIAAGSASGVGSAAIQFSYSANSNPGAQTGTLTIAGLTFTVTQAGTSYVSVTPVTPLVSSGLNNPQGAAVDGQGNVYIADTANNVIKEWNPGTQQTVQLSSAQSSPGAVAVDGHGNVYIADSGNHAIEEFSPANQQLTTLVSGLSNPSGVAVDGQGNVYFSDTSNNLIEEWNAASQQVTTLAGAGLSNPTGVAVDGQGNVYFADSGHNAIKEWVAAGGQVTALVSSGLNNPVGVAVDGQGNVYSADTGNNAIKQWNAGSQQVATLVSTGLNSPMGVAVDGQGNIYVADTNNNAIEKLTPGYLALSAGSLNEGAQAGTDSVTAQVLPASIPLTATSDQPWLTLTGIASGVIGFSFASNTTGADRTGHITVLGLQVTVTQSGDVPSSLTKCAGDGQSARAGQPFATALQVCVSDAGGNPLSGWPVTFSATPGASGASGTFSANPPMPILTNASGSATAPVLTANGIGGTFTVTASVNALSVTFTMTNLVNTLGASSAIVGNTAGSGSVLLVTGGAWTATRNASWLQLSAGSTSGTGNASIQFSYGANPNATAQTGTLTISGLTFTVTQAGASFTPIGLVTALVSSGLKGPLAVAVDGPGNVYVADSSNNALKKWSVSTQQVSTLVSSGLNDPTGVAVDSQGNVYFADSKNNAIKEWSVATGQVTSLVSTGLSSPVGVAVDSQGNVYFSDAGHNAIKEWVAASKLVATLVSSGLNVPLGVAVDAQGNVYFADEKNNAIKEWSAATKLVLTLVSSGLNAPYGVAVDGDGNVYFADTANNAIKAWSPASRQVTVLVSTGLKSPSGVAVDGQGTVYIADTYDSAIKKYAAVDLSLGASSWNEGAAAGTDSISFQVLPASTPVTATSNRSWLTITGTGGGAIGFSYKANTSVSSRTAQIKVLGQAVTVTQGGDTPATITKVAGNKQTAPAGQAFATALEVRVTDAAGNGVQGASVTFMAVPGSKGASGTFSSSPPIPILTGPLGYAIAPALTANSVAGTFTVTASVGTLTTTFTLTN